MQSDAKTHRQAVYSQACK